MVEGIAPIQPLQSLVDRLIRAGLASPLVAELDPRLREQKAHQQGAQRQVDHLRITDIDDHARNQDGHAAEHQRLPDPGITFYEFGVDQNIHRTPGSFLVAFDHHAGVLSAQPK